MKSTISSQPAWCCHTCGIAYGRWYTTGIYKGPSKHLATWHIGTCGVCNTEDIEVTEPRDFGYLIPAWDKARRYALRRV